MSSPFNSVADVRKYMAELDAKDCPVAKRQRELQEAERERARKEREAKLDTPQYDWTAWERWADARADARILAHMQRDGLIHEPVGAVIGIKHREMRDHVTGEIEKLRAEFRDAGEKLREEFHERLARLPLEVKTWEPVSEVLDQFRQEAHEEARSELHAAVATLHDEFNVATNKLHTEINTRLARLPLVKTWEPDAVHYMGEVVVHEGGVYQARKDTGKEPDHADWILLARAGRDDRDGRTPNVCGTFDAYKTYTRLDVVQCGDGNSYIARVDDPGICPGDGWQLMARGGGRGPSGETGVRGQRGSRGPRGEDAPTVIAWTLDRKNYRAVPTMSNGTQGAVLDLRGLFEQFNEEAVLTGIDAAVKDAARTPKLLAPL